MPAAANRARERVAAFARPPIFDAFRRVGETVAGFARPPIFDAFRRVGETVAGFVKPVLGVFQRAGDWASGFVAYGAGLRRLTESIFGSWLWKLPDLGNIIKQITDKILTAFRVLGWPGWPSLTQTIAGKRLPVGRVIGKQNAGSVLDEHHQPVVDHKIAADRHEQVQEFVSAHRGWRLRLDARRTMRFNGVLADLRDWARRVGLLRGTAQPWHRAGAVGPA